MVAKDMSYFNEVLALVAQHQVSNDETHPTPIEEEEIANNETQEEVLLQ
jgi:hypothetical protein